MPDQHYDAIVIGTSQGGRFLSLAMLGKLPYTAMAEAIFTHPLLAEGLKPLFAMFDA